MGDNSKLLKFHWIGKEVSLTVDVDKSNLLDIIIDYEDDAKKMGIRLDYHYPTFSYVWKMKHMPLITDDDLMKMYERLVDKEVISVWVGSVLKPNDLYKLVLNFRRRAENERKEKRKEVQTHEGNGDDNQMQSDEGIGLHSAFNEDNSRVIENANMSEVFELEPAKTKGKKAKKTPKRAPKTKTIVTNIPPPMTPKTAFKTLTVRRSPRFSPIPYTSQIVPPDVTSSVPDQTLFNRKIPRTSAKSYNYSISPVPDKDQWPAYENLPIISPPTMKRGVGRPCRNRKREEGEDPKGKRSKTVKCKKCDCYGHNARTCKGGLTEKEKQELHASGKPAVIKYPRVRDQSYVAKAAKAEATKAAKAARAEAAQAANVATTQTSQANSSQCPISQSQQEI